MDQPEPSQPGAPVTDGDKSQPCVLLVEDDRSLRRYLEVTLQRAGYHVLAAGDGLEAMKLALSTDVHIVVTDAIMPQLSGQQLAAFLRGNDKLSKIPIILLTGQENRSAVSAASTPIDAFLCKPVKAAELTSCLSKLLSPSPNQVAQSNSSSGV
ncbi:MAG TPA: response regulator [Pyrinomonadaceae bacterium]|nr:response regulator [Pyrinomonadaceae bacterium]